MAETAYQTHYAGQKKPKRRLNPSPKTIRKWQFARKWKTGGAKHVIASKGGSLT